MEQRIIADIMYSAVEIAKLLHTDIQNIYKWVKTGEIPHIKLTEKSEIRFAGIGAFTVYLIIAMAIVIL